jgi:hypothetical protein
MTEAEWLGDGDVKALLGFACARGSERKLRLFACACCRFQWRRLEERSRRAVEVAERFADGAAGRRELHDAFTRAADAYAFSGSAAAAGAALVAGAEARDYAARVTPKPEHPGLLRELFGPLLFREVRLEPAWLAADGGVVPHIARGVYRERAHDRLPVLADALEDAGCGHPELLAHLRGSGPHVRGCWALDLILGLS